MTHMHSTFILNIFYKQIMFNIFCLLPYVCIPVCVLGMCTDIHLIVHYITIVSGGFKLGKYRFNAVKVFGNRITESIETPLDDVEYGYTVSVFSSSDFVVDIALIFHYCIF